MGVKVSNMKDKIKKLLILMLDNSDTSGNLSFNLRDYSKMLNITSSIFQHIRKFGYIEGNGRQSKRINYQEVSDEMVDKIYKEYYHYQNETRHSKSVSIENMSLDQKIDYLFSVTASIYQKLEDIEKIVRPISYINDITIKLEEFLD